MTEAPTHDEGRRSSWSSPFAPTGTIAAGTSGASFDGLPSLTEYCCSDSSIRYDDGWFGPGRPSTAKGMIAKLNVLDRRAPLYAKTLKAGMTKGTRLAGCVYLREEDANIRRMNRDRHSAVRYRASIAAGSLKVFESRTIADLLLRGVNAHDWRAEVTERNVFQIRSPKTAARLAQLLRARLEVNNHRLEGGGFKGLGN